MGSASLMPWALLEANDSRRVPLFYRFQADADGYTAQLTDLIDFWEESRTKSEITDTARRIDSSIDPSQDESQLLVIYDKLRDAFAARAATSLTFDEDSAHSTLSVHAKCDLPRPLRPFKWKLRFAHCHSSRLRDAVLAPLARQCHRKDLKINALVQLLAEKDDALTRILDKADSAGLDPSAIFPSARSRSDEILTRKLLEQRVKALRRFKPEDLESITDAGSSSLDLEQLFSTALSEVVPSVEPAQPEWPTTLARKDGGDTPSPDGHSDDYQRQPTPPPRVRPISPNSSPRIRNEFKMDLDGDETTDDSEADDIVGQQLHAQSPPQSPKPQVEGRRRIGTVASRKSPSSSGDTQSADKAQSATSPADLKPQKPRIGSVGGRRALGSDKRDGSIGDHPVETTAALRSKAVPGTAKSDAKDPAIDSSRKLPAPGDTLMTDDEKANEKRAQLKRELEAQSKAVTKKKRRF